MPHDRKANPLVCHTDTASRKKKKTRTPQSTPCSSIDPIPRIVSRSSVYRYILPQGSADIRVGAILLLLVLLASSAGPSFSRFTEVPAPALAAALVVIVVEVVVEVTEAETTAGVAAT
jgi:hypothetical protein